MFVGYCQLIQQIFISKLLMILACKMHYLLVFNLLLPVISVPSPGGPHISQNTQNNMYI